MDQLNKEFVKKKTQESSYAHYNTSKDSPWSQNYDPKSEWGRTYPKGFEPTKTSTPEQKDNESTTSDKRTIRAFNHNFMLLVKD